MQIQIYVPVRTRDSCVAGARHSGKFRFSLCLYTISSSASPGLKNLSVLLFSREYNCKYLWLLGSVQAEHLLCLLCLARLLLIMLIATAVRAGRGKVNQKLAIRMSKSTSTSVPSRYSQVPTQNKTAAYECANAIQSSAVKVTFNASSTLAEQRQAAAGFVLGFECKVSIALHEYPEGVGPCASECMCVCVQAIISACAVVCVCRCTCSDVCLCTFVWIGARCLIKQMHPQNTHTHTRASR